MVKFLHVSTIAMLMSGLTAFSQGSNDDMRYLRQPLPEQWKFTPDHIQTLPSDDPWWKSFEDSTLDSLIAIGIDNNFNVAEATHRREMARLAIRQAQSAYFPSIGLAAGYTRSHVRHDDTNGFSLGADVSWEIDLFGKITSQVNATKASYQTSRAEYLATMVSITSEIATYYIDYRVLQNEIAVANEHIGSQKRVVEITEARHEAGLVSKLDVAQAKTLYYTTQATLPSLKSQSEQTLNALAILLGCYPSELRPMLEGRTNLPTYQHLIPSEMPADMVRRRPDIAEAEANLALYAAKIGIAKKDFLPTLSLEGTLGWSGEKLGGMFDSNHFTYSIAPKLSWTLFSGLSRKYALAQAKEQMQIGIDAYNLTVMTAYTEVENAMTAYRSALETLNLEKSVFEQSRESFDLAIEQYTQGLSAFTNVVNAQIDWLNCANTLVTAHGNALTSLVNLYKALGGAPVE